MPKTTIRILDLGFKGRLKRNSEWYSEEEIQGLIKSERLKLFSAIMVSGAIEDEDEDIRYNKIKSIFGVIDKE